MLCRRFFFFGAHARATCIQLTIRGFRHVPPKGLKSKLRATHDAMFTFDELQARLKQYSLWGRGETEIKLSNFQ